MDNLITAHQFSKIVHTMQYKDSSIIMFSMGRKTEYAAAGVIRPVVLTLANSEKIPIYVSGNFIITPLD